MIYAVVPIDSNENQKLMLDTKIKELVGNKVTHDRVQWVNVYTETAPNIYFVIYHGTTKELSQEIGFGDDLNIGTGIVLQVSSYHGYAQKTLWEWLGVYGK